MTQSRFFAAFLFAAFALACLPITASADSHVRIVRLSYIDGKVQVDRATGSGLERAILNTPVVEKTRIVTAADGLAEVEFENGNTLRLAGDSEVQFSQLLVNDAGQKINEIKVTRGTLYLDARAKGDDVYRLMADGKTLVAQRGTQMRLSAAPDQLRLAVFKGEVQLPGSQPLTVKRKETLTVDPQIAAGYTLARNVEAQPTDSWNNEREAYGQTYARSYGYGGPTSGYGLQDLNYYGDFAFYPGYGYGWQPYGFSSAMMNWSPYSNGAWLFSPGLGYGFATSYPWGWLPYHYGSWAFLGNTGWVWLPGGGYNGAWYSNGFRNVPKIVKQPAGWSAPVPPTTSVVSSPKPTVVVGNLTASPAYIPGGRVPPNFASVIPGHTTHPAATANTFVHPAATTQTLNSTAITHAQVTDVAAHSGRSGHVFAAPATFAGRGGFEDIGEPRGAWVGSRGAAQGVSPGHSASVGHSSGGSHH